MTYKVTTTRSGRVIREQECDSFDAVKVELYENCLPADFNLWRAARETDQIDAEGGTIELPGRVLVKVEVVS